MADTNLVGNVLQQAGQVQEQQNAATNQGIGLAKAFQDMQAKKVQTDQLQEQLETSKFNTLNNNMQTLAKMRPEVAKRMVPAMKERLQQSGIAVDPGVLDLVASDENYKQRMLSLSQTAGQLGSDPAARMQFLAAHQDLGDFDKGLNQLEGYDKELSAQRIAQLNADKTLAAAKITGGYRVEAAKQVGGRMEIRNKIQANRQYDQVMGKSEDALQAAAMLNEVTKDVDSGEITTNKNIRGDVQSKIASLLAGGRPSTVYGQQAVEMDSAYQHIQDFKNKYLGEAGGTVPPAQWDQLKKDIAALSEANANLHERKFQGFRKGLQGTPGAENVDARYDETRSGFGLSGTSVQPSQHYKPGTAPAAPPGAPAWASKYKSKAAQQVIQESLSAGHKQEEIEPALKAAGLE